MMLLYRQQVTYKVTSAAQTKGDIQLTNYAITGVTGRFGRAALKTLIDLVPADHIIALARNVEKAKTMVPAGVEVRPGDYANTDQLKASLTGVDRLLLVSSQPGQAMPRLQQHKDVIDAAKAAGVAYIAYTSFPHADTATTPLADDHKQTEAYIKASGLAYSFLRNNWYLENEADVLKGAMAGQPLVYSAGAGKAGWALEREYAEAGARVLAADNTKAIYELAGQARTYQDLADAIDASFDVLAVDDAAYEQGLEKAGLDAGTAALVTSFQTLIRDGQLDEDTDDLPTVLGRELTPLADAIKIVTAE